MKNKKNIYLLVPAVLLIWGLIGYKIIKAANPTDQQDAQENALVEFVPDKIKEVEKFAINANYRDPFLGKLFTKKTPKRTTKSVKKKPKQVVEFPEIAYNGMVAPKETDRPTLFLITIHNKQQFLSIGKQIEDVKLLKGNNKEITISYKNIKKIVAIQQ
jgi:hypothetical protein